MRRINKIRKSFSIMLLVICTILSSTVMRADANGTADYIDVTDSMYTYEEMQEDIALLAKTYPEFFHYEIVGKSWDNRLIYKLIIGNVNAKKSVFVESGTHAREYMNCMLTMKQAEFYLQNLDAIYMNNLTYKDILTECNIVMLPMVNPDGITISQYGPKAIQNETLRNNLMLMPGIKNASRWKANANGVDLNRNWNVFWNREVLSTVPTGGTKGNAYNGPYAESEPEVQAMKSVIEDIRYNWVAIISFHSMEGAIYYLLDYYPNDETRVACTDFAYKCSKLSGYKAVNYEVSKARGLFYNYCIINKGLRTVCVETGYKACPLPYSQWKGVWKSNWQLPIYSAMDYGM